MDMPGMRSRGLWNTLLGVGVRFRLHASHRPEVGAGAVKISWHCIRGDPVAIENGSFTWDPESSSFLTSVTPVT